MRCGSCRRRYCQTASLVNQARIRCSLLLPCLSSWPDYLKKNRVGEDLLVTLQKLMRAVPGGLALAVTAMVTILAAATSIIGATVVMLTVLALPTMLERGYSPELASGTVVSAGTLGILIPPSVMLVFMGDILTINLAKLFVAALFPGLDLACFYMIYIVIVSTLRPDQAPKAPPLSDEKKSGLLSEIILSFALPFIFNCLLTRLYSRWQYHPY